MPIREEGELDQDVDYHRHGNADAERCHSKIRRSRELGPVSQGTSIDRLGGVVPFYGMCNA